jgi:hypothetical protein
VIFKKQINKKSKRGGGKKGIEDDKEERETLR